MTLTTRDGREVEVTVMGESDDVQIDKAKYDDGADVPDDVVDQLLEDNGDALYEAWQEQARDQAEHDADCAADR